LTFRSSLEVNDDTGVEQTKPSSIGFPDILASHPVTNSASLGLQDFSLETHYLPEGGTSELCLPHYVIGLNNAPMMNCEFKADGRLHQFPMLAGEMNIAPAGANFETSWDRKIQSTTLNLSVELLNRNALALWGHSDFELGFQLKVDDPFIRQLSLEISHEITSVAPNRMYVMTMVNSLAVQLLHKFSNQAHKSIQNLGSLSPQQLKIVVNYIGQNIDKDLTLKKLASLVQISQHHFARSFKQTMDITPHQYIIQQRIKLSQQLLRQLHLRIDEVALACGFSHQSHLNRHFKRYMGLTPKQFREEYRRRSFPLHSARED